MNESIGEESGKAKAERIVELIHTGLSIGLVTESAASKISRNFSQTGMHHVVWGEDVCHIVPKWFGTVH